MTADPLAALTAALGRHPPDAVAALPDDVLGDLTASLRAARSAQAAALERSLESATRLAPFPVRGLVRKMLA